jgi:hypothetical protein
MDSFQPNNFIIFAAHWLDHQCLLQNIRIFCAKQFYCSTEVNEFRHGFRSPSPLAIPPNESFAIFRQTPYRNVLIKIYYTTLNAMK